MPAIEIYDEDNLLFSEEQRKARYMLVTCMFKDYPLHYSQNFRTPRNKFFFGYAQVMYGDYVYSTIPLEYDGQIIYEFRNDLSQVNAFIDCAVRQLRDLIITSHNLQFSSSPLVPVENPLPMTLGCPATHIRFSVIRGASILVQTYPDPLLFCSPVAPEVIPPDLPAPRDEGDELGTNPPSLSDDTGELNGRGGVRPKQDEPPPPPPPEPEPGTMKRITIRATATVFRFGAYETVTAEDTGVFAWPISVETSIDYPVGTGSACGAKIDVFSGGVRMGNSYAKIEGYECGSYNYVVIYSDP